MARGKVRAGAAVLVAVGVTAGLAAGAACAPSRSASRTTGGSPRLTVAATVAPIVDIVRQVVGDRVRLVGLIPEGVDSHTFEPSPETVKSLARGDVLFMDGLHLEGSTLKQAEANMPHPVAEPASTAAALTGSGKGSEIIQMGDLTVNPS